MKPKICFRVIYISFITGIYSRTLDISFQHEEVFGVKGADTFDDPPIVTDQVKLSKLRWEDNEGHYGDFNFTNPGWADQYTNIEPKRVLVYDSPEFYSDHHNKDWYDSDDYLNNYDSPAWLDNNAELKPIKAGTDKDYYDFLMQLYAEQQRMRDSPNAPIIMNNFDARKKKSVDVIEQQTEDQEKRTEPCTSRSLRLCNIYFTIPLISVVVITLIGIYFSTLFCYLKNPWSTCTKFCPCMYKYGNKYMRTKWGDEASLKIHVNEVAQEYEELLTV